MVHSDETDGDEAQAACSHAPGPAVPALERASALLRTAKTADASPAAEPGPRAAAADASWSARATGARSRAPTTPGRAGIAARHISIATASSRPVQIRCLRLFSGSSGGCSHPIWRRGLREAPERRREKRSPCQPPHFSPSTSAVVRPAREPALARLSA